MPLYALEIPEDTTQLWSWLEQHLVNLHLGELVAELSAIHADHSAANQSLQEILAEEHQQVLANGLRELSQEKQKALLQNPLLLLELQAEVLASQSVYWEQVAIDEQEFRPLVSNNTQHLKDAFGDPATSEITAGRSSLEPTSVAPSTSTSPLKEFNRSSLQLMAFTALGTAAAVLICVWGLQTSTQSTFDQVATTLPNHTKSPSKQPSGIGWGWAKQDAIPEDVTSEEYLNSLANTANQWFKKRPESADALATRVLEFRQGCSTLIFHSHQPLTQEDRDWLVEKCRLWATKLDTHLQELEAGKEVLAVRDQVDDTINKLITALKTKASQV